MPDTAAAYVPEAVKALWLLTLGGMPFIHRYYNGSVEVAKVGDDAFFTGAVTSFRTLLPQQIKGTPEMKEFVLGDYRFLLRESEKLGGIMVVDAVERELEPFYQKLDAVFDYIGENYGDAIKIEQGLLRSETAYDGVDEIMELKGSGVLGRNENGSVAQPQEFNPQKIMTDITNLFKNYKSTE